MAWTAKVLPQRAKRFARGSNSEVAGEGDFYVIDYGLSPREVRNLAHSGPKSPGEAVQPPVLFWAKDAPQYLSFERAYIR